MRVAGFRLVLLAIRLSSKNICRKLILSFYQLSITIIGHCLLLNDFCFCRSIHVRHFIVIKYFARLSWRLSLMGTGSDIPGNTHTRQGYAQMFPSAQLSPIILLARTIPSLRPYVPLSTHPRLLIQLPTNLQ